MCSLLCTWSTRRRAHGLADLLNSMPQLVRLSLQEVPASIDRGPAAMGDQVAARKDVRDHPDVAGLLQPSL